MLSSMSPLPSTIIPHSLVSMQARHSSSSSGAVNDVSGMIRTIIPHSLVKAILASHNETKSNRCSSMASASE